MTAAVGGGGRLSRTGSAIGLACVVVGTAWSVGRADVVQDVVRHWPLIAGVGLAVVGILALWRSADPHGALLGPLLLIAVGGIVLAVYFGVLTTRHLRQAAPIGLIVGGAVLVMRRTRRRPKLDTGVARHFSVLLPVNKTIAGRAPSKVIVRAVLGCVRLDLSEASPAYGMTVDITVLSGVVVLTCPRAWRITAGRVDLARSMRFHGVLDSAGPADKSDPSRSVTLNILGWGGKIVVRRAAEDSSV